MRMNKIIAAALAIFAPPPSLTVSEWADRYRYLSPESSAEPGQVEHRPRPLPARHHGFRRRPRG